MTSKCCYFILVIYIFATSEGIDPRLVKANKTGIKIHVGRKSTISNIFVKERKTLISIQHTAFNYRQKKGFAINTIKLRQEKLQRNASKAPYDILQKGTPAKLHLPYQLGKISKNFLWCNNL